MYNTMRVLGIACELCSMQGAQLWGFSNSRGEDSMGGVGRRRTYSREANAPIRIPTISRTTFCSPNWF